MAADVSTSSVQSSSPSRHISVVDVYDLASSIKFDLEEIVKHYGKQCVQDLACKVVSALETLEALAKNNDRVNGAVSELQKEIERLESERIQRSRDKENFEKEMVEFEEALKRENADLWQMIETLQSEKKTLQEKVSSLAEQTLEEKEKEGYVVMRDEEYQVLVRLKELNVDYKDRIKELNGTLRSSETEANELRGNIEKLIGQNYELVRKNKSLQKQCKALLRQRNELSDKVEAMEEDSIHLRQTLHETSRACRDLESQRRMPEDADTPRFSINELREVLQEKTSLKQLVIQLREELETLKIDRPNSESAASDITFDTPDTTMPRASSTVTTSACESEIGSDSAIVDESNRSTDEELVYGPINKEPEEKLYPWKYQRRASGIRKMFGMFFPPK